jgi:hypothetical protein
VVEGSKELIGKTINVEITEATPFFLKGKALTPVTGA